MAAGTTTLMLIGLGGCDGIWAKDAYTALQIVQVQINTGEGGLSCTIPAEPTDLHRTKGTLDIGLPDKVRPYVLPVSIHNAMGAVGETEAEEFNNIRLHSFHVELSGYNTVTGKNIVWDNEKCPASFDQDYGTVLIPPTGYSGASVDVLLVNHANCLLDQFPALITAKITAVGRHGGTSIKSAPFEFMLTVCYGCLQRDYADPQIASLGGLLPECVALTSNPYPGGCYPGQDEPILCCAERPVPPATQIRYHCPAIPMGTSASSSP
jgi:hypothetical protein